MKYLLVLLLLLTGCAPAQLPTSGARTIVYDCGGGYRFTLRPENGRAELLLPGETRSLPQTSSASGVRYADAEVEVWRRKGRARLEIRKQGERVCREDRVASIWEEARLRGVDFRAAGNDPGRILELERANIVYVGNYGRQQLRFPDVRSLVDDRKAQTLYTGTAEGHKLEMLLQAGDCYDSMSGEKFDTRVTLRLDKRTLYGCGRVLH